MTAEELIWAEEVGNYLDLGQTSVEYDALLRERVSEFISSSKSLVNERNKSYGKN